MASSFKNFLSTALPIAGVATGNPFLAAAGGAAGGAFSGGAKGALMGGITGGAASYLGSKLPASIKGFNPFSSFGGFGSGGGSGSGGGGGSYNPLALGSKVGGGYNVGMGNPNSMNLAAKAMNQKDSSGLFNKTNLLGLGTMLGSQLIRSPKVPELPQSVIDFQNAARSGNPLQNKAQEALMGQLNQTQQNLGQPEIDALTRQYDLAQEQELKQVDSVYKSLRPGTDPTTDSSYQKDIGRIRDRYAQLKAESVATAQRQISNDFQSQRANQIAQAAGLSQQQLQQLSQLSQYDLDKQLSQLNIDYADKSTLRNYLLQLGGNIFASQYEQQNPLLSLLRAA